MTASGGALVHIGRREHYRLACDVVARRPLRVVLMQRSSTVILGPEDGWSLEADFHRELWRAIEAGAVCHHVASIDGIRRHLMRATSRFSRCAESVSRLVLDGNVIAMPCTDSVRAIKILPDGPRDDLDEDFKFDRQARVVVADFESHVEALLVSDIGDQQCTLHLTGDAPARMLDLSLAWYERCPALTVEALRRGLGTEATAAINALFARCEQAGTTTRA